MAVTDPYAGFRFVVLLDQVRVAGFAKVRGLGRETRVETFREGGVNDHEHKLVTMTSYGNLILERGLADPEMLVWHQLVIEGRVLRRMLTISLRDENDREAWSWLVHGAFPVKWSVADFDAASGQIVAETVELAHNGFLVKPGLRGSRAA
ncbi:phage tail protein [Sphingosinicella sp. BN140058]|uniref:phage tail protein n=1 Tax=Sphingosinicella sp. BN140058 TaxID=1892855 RepID=UPI001013B24D|nr:phage tail protein [Sphingosinicella sp. BN140058]QAY79317.1 phage tail protein [Sphingosinicella sp. BN140058]